MRKLLLFIRLHKTLFRVNGRPLEFTLPFITLQSAGPLDVVPYRFAQPRIAMKDSGSRYIAIAQNVPPSSFTKSVKDLPFWRKGD